MKIAWFIQDLKKGGGHRVCLEVSKVLATRGHDVIILVPKGRLQTTVPEPLKVIECGRPFENPILSILLNGPAILGKLPRVDIVLSTMPYMAFLNTIATWLRPARGIHFVMADDYHLFDDRTLIRSLFLLGLHKLSVLISYRLPLLIIANSRWTRDQTALHGPKPRHILNPGINPEVFCPPKRKSRPTGTYNLLTMPRKHAMKGWPELVDSLNALWEERQDFKVTGVTQDPINKDSCKFPLDVVSPTDDPELVRYLRTADLFISASQMEGIPLPPLEAMACGVPVVSTDIDGVREYAVHGVNAWLVPVNLPTEMKDAINHLLDDKEIRNRLIAEGLKTAKRFTWQAWVEGLERILDQQIGND